MIDLKNGVQIPESAIVQQITASLDVTYVSGPLSLVQYDDTMPVVAVQLTVNNQPYIPGESAELNYRMGKPWPDTHAVYNPCLGVDEDGVVYFSITLQGTTTPGETTLTVEVTDGGVKNSAPIRVLIARNPVQEGQIESEDEFLTLQEILAQCQKYGQIVEANAGNIQTVIDEMDAIKDAPAAAERAEAAAAEAEKSAAESKGFRTFFSAVTPDANGNLDPSRPMTVGPAASVEIESAGDRIQSVTARGFTAQAGTGDPSPTNVRALTNGGLKLVKVVFNGTENWSQNSGSTNTGYLYLRITAAANSSHYAISNILGFNYSYGGNGVFAADNYLYFGAAFGKQYTLGTWKAMLADRYAAGDPVTVWYQPADESDATGLYAPIILTSGEYRATCLPLTAPLCEGDSVVSWAKSGCDKFETFDGSSDEGWVFEPISIGGNRYYIQLENAAQADAATGHAIANWLRLGYQGETADTGVTFTFTITSAGQLYVRSENESLEDFKARLAAHPLTVWYRSTNYTEAADIPVSLETHQQAVLVLDGTESGSINPRDGYISIPLTAAKMPNLAKGGGNSGVSSIAKSRYVISGDGFYWNPNSRNLIFGKTYADQFESYEAFQAKMAKLYAAGTPAQFVYPLATPITYAHEPVVLEAATGEQLTYTVTGQSGGTVSVALKPMQDGGHAKTAENATNAVTAQTAANSQRLGGLTLSALQNRLVPVGYIFSWAPASGGPDLSTAQKVAAYFGFGTWQAYGTGQVLVGVDPSQTEFATVGKTGGEKTHQLTIAELAKHSHKMYWSNEGGTGTGNGVLVRDALSGGPWPYSYYTETDGSSQPHNNLQPYITVYRWQRIA